MSLVGIAWDEKRLRLSCQPDPSRPACCLDELCDIDVPQTVVLSENDGKQRRVFVPELLMAFFDTKKSKPAAIENNLLQAALSEYFTRLIPFLEESVDVQVLLMESIDHLAFVVPMGSDPSRIKEFKRIAESVAGFDVTVIAYATACAALAMGRFISKRPYLLCEWTDELILSAAFSYDTLRHYSRIKPHYIFAPSIDDDGFARIKVSMKVENREADGLTTVSINLEDVVSHKKVSFQRLHLTGGTPMECPPLRHYGELKGMELAGKIEDKRKTLNKEQTLSPNEWRRLLEEPVMRKKVTRKDYATQIMVTVVEDRLMFFWEHYPPLLDTFLDENFIHTASPEEFQAAGRDMLFFAMHALAGTVSELNQKHGRAADWAAAHPFTQGSSTSGISVVNSFVNALSHDLAGNQMEDDYMQQANRIKECYSLTCSDPHGLNVDWRVQD